MSNPGHKRAAIGNLSPGLVKSFEPMLGRNSSLNRPLKRSM